MRCVLEFEFIIAKREAAVIPAIHRTRRIKCDETKPQCLRCVRFMGFCDGYAPPKKRYDRTSQLVETLESVGCMPALRPKSRLEQKSTSSPILFRPLEKPQFRNSDEHCAFLAFLKFQQHKTNELSGLFASALWDSIVLQESNGEDFVRDAIIAIGALVSSETKSIGGPARGRLPELIPTPRYQFALQQYGRAVKRMREKLVASENNLRKTLISCLLVICFEGLQGNYEGVLKHSTSGCALLQDWLDPGKPKSSNTAKALKKDGVASPAKYVVEDELIQAFTRLDLQLLSIMDPRPPDRHRILLAEGQSTIDSMPKPFTSIKEARTYLELVQRRNQRLILVSAARKAKNPKLGTAILSVAPYTYTFYPKSKPSISINEPKHPNIWSIGHQRMADLHNWFDAFEPFYASVPRHTPNWVPASKLKIQAQCAKLSLLIAISSDEYSVDRLLPDFRAMVALGNEIAKDPLFSNENIFFFEVGIVSSLRFVCKFCRDPKVRRDAIALMRRVSANEGLFRASMLADLSEWVMNLEEEGMDENGYIPESERWVPLETIVVGHRAARQKYVKQGTIADAKPDIREIIFNW